MYSSKKSVNTLTALLVAHGIRHAVVCPGSRNAPIVHNLNECPLITCHPVTDERSAGFFALGIAQATDQPGALQAWVAKTVSLPDGGSPWHCNRLVNEALIEATADHRPCVHINVELSEPLFHFTTAQLPSERVIRRYAPAADYDCLPQALVDDLLSAQRPLIVFGQLSPRRFHYEGFGYLFSHVVVLHEALAPFTSVSHFERVLSTQQAVPAPPDFILHVGDAIVSKRLKHFLRQADGARTWRISLTGEVEDTFQNLRGIVVGDAERTLQSLDVKLRKGIRRHTAALSATLKHHAEYRRQWLQLLTAAKTADEAAADASTCAAVVQAFEQQLQRLGPSFEVHYANSTPVRLANIYAHGHPVWCNRGTNGIDGSLSTAAGFAAAVEATVFCVIGDLSFFYDQNALWNQHLRGNLRILLLNNGHGAIFDALPGLSDSPAATTFVSGAHATTADGICRQNHIAYRHVDCPSNSDSSESPESPNSLADALQWLTAPSDDRRPRLLEVCLPGRKVGTD